ncbi:protein of unknown function [Ruminococcaceae bacterium BL-6]|nr:protein of unknown function [Ruminococcaceae bacterium BL-6]
MGLRGQDSAGNAGILFYFKRGKKSTPAGDLCYNNLTALAEAKLPTPERTLKHALRHVIDNLTAFAEVKLPTHERTLMSAPRISRPCGYNIFNFTAGAALRMKPYLRFEYFYHK